MCIIKMLMCFSKKQCHFSTMLNTLLITACSESSYNSSCLITKTNTEKWIAWNDIVKKTLQNGGNDGSV